MVEGYKKHDELGKLRALSAELTQKVKERQQKLKEEVCITSTVHV